MAYYGGLDIGTSGTRILVTDSSLHPVFEESRGYEPTSPREGWEEQDPQVVLDACRELIREALQRCAGQPLVLAFSSVMHSIMAVDGQGRPRTALIPWLDSRSQEECQRLEQEPGREWFFERTACPIHPSYWPGKILWMRRNLADSHGLRFVSIKEYVLYHLAGRWQVDWSVAASSGLLNIHRHEYDPEILELLELSPENLSPVVPPGEQFRFVLAGAEITGVTGAADGVLANLGAGAVEKEESVLTVGSSSAVRFVSPEPVLDPQMRAWCYPLDRDLYVVGEATNAGGMVLHWLAEIMGYEEEKRMVDELLGPVPYPGNDLYFSPTLLGERAPDYDDTLRGFFAGLTMHHSRSDLVAAVYEGILFFNRLVLEDLARVCGAPPQTLLLSGGLGMSPRFRRLVAYGIQPAAYLPDYPESTALGAVMLGLKAASGRCFREQVRLLPPRAPVEVEEDEEFRGYLRGKYERFLRLHERLRSEEELLG